MSMIEYRSSSRKDSAVYPGVRFVVEKISFARRIELMKTIREVAGRAEFEVAAGDSGKMDGAILGAEIEKAYIRWGLKEIEGLMIDGEQATPELLIAAGPEDVLKEILAAIKTECGLSEEEKKT